MPEVKDRLLAITAEHEEMRIAIAKEMGFDKVAICTCGINISGCKSGIAGPPPPNAAKPTCARKDYGEESRGARIEVNLARELSMPVVRSTEILL